MRSLLSDDASIEGNATIMPPAPHTVASSLSLSIQLGPGKLVERTYLLQICFDFFVCSTIEHNARNFFGARYSLTKKHLEVAPT